MDLGAHAISDIPIVERYIEKHYGSIPRLRGVRFMAIEKPDVCDGCGWQEDNMFRKYVGEDVIYIHTRCGPCGDWDDESSNYIYCHGKDWEEDHKDLFLDHVEDGFDSTYATHYFTAVIDDDYKNILMLAAGGLLY